MNRMVFLRSVNVTLAEPIRIFAKIVKILVDILQTYNRERERERGD